jgi:hypothetical protein
LVNSCCSVDDRHPDAHTVLDPKLFIHPGTE